MVICQHCGTRAFDPGEDLQGWTCGNCGMATLVRFPDPPPIQTKPKSSIGAAIATAAIGAAVGGFVGPVGACVGGILGFAFGHIVGERK